MSIIPVTVPTGAIRYNTDSNKMECFNGTQWMQVSVSSPVLANRGIRSSAGIGTDSRNEEYGGARGIAAGGNPSTNTIDYFTISTLGDAVDFGDLTAASELGCTGSSNTRALTCHGTTSHLNSIDYITMSTTGNAVDFGDHSAIRNNSCGGNQTRMIIAGGITGSNPYTYYNTVEYVTIAATGNAVDFGDLTKQVGDPFSMSSPTRHVTVGGGLVSGTPGASDIIDFTTIATIGNYQDFGDLSIGGNNGGKASCSSTTRGLVLGGRVGGTTISEIQTLQMATLGDSKRFGDLTQTQRFGAGTSDKTRGIRVGGYITPSNANTDTMDYVSISTEGNAVDFGNLTSARRSFQCTSNDHGGL